MFILSNFYDNIGIHTANLKTQLKTNVILKLSQHFFFFSVMNRKEMLFCKSPVMRENIVCYCVINMRKSHDR